MTAAERYRRYAAECIRVAEHTENSGDRLLLFQMAQTWQRLAESAEKSGSPTGNEDLT
jgi:hypothetical protein